MATTTKCVFATFGFMVLVAAFIVTILGIVLMTTSVPQATECGRVSVDEDVHDFASMWLCWPIVVGGFLALVGGGLSVGCGMQQNKCGIKGATVLFHTAGVFLVGGCLGLMYFAAVVEANSSLMCDDEDDLGSWASSDYAASLPQAEQAAYAAHAACSAASSKATNDWNCDNANKRMAALAFSIIVAIVTFLAGGFGCAAACCCADKWDWAGTPKGGVGGGAQPAVIGQPVGVTNAPC